jgi:hypothetical protein
MFPVMSAGNPITGYNINNSLRFRRSNSAYLSRTPASAGNRQKWTVSFWIKRGGLASTYAYQYMFGAYSGSSALETALNFNNDDTITFFNYASGAYTLNATTTAVFRDPSAWYHIVLAIDTTQATSSNGIKLYVNGTLQTLTIPTYTQNTSTYVNNNNVQLISNNANLNSWVDGYYAEIIMVDGSQLTPSSFGASDTLTGQWLPKQYSGTYGTNGFKLNFSDTSAATAAAIGKDSSGNGNNWTPSGISVTTGTTYDAMLDSPTLTSPTVGNYCVWNPLNSPVGQLNTIMSNGNLTTTDANSASYNSGASATFGVTSGKWYWENTIGSGTPERTCVGITLESNSNPLINGISYDPYASSGSIRRMLNGNPTVLQSSLGSVVAGDIVAVALDADAQTVKWYKNNVQVGTTVTYTSYLPTGSSVVYAGFWTPNQSGASVSTTFGQRPFTYTPPTGYVALNTYNLPTPTIKAGNKYMDATTYTGNNTTNVITNAAAFKPDFLWIKTRSAGAYNHHLMNSVTGATKHLISNSTGAEITDTSVTSFNSNGFTLATDATYLETNQNGSTYVGWQWQAGQGSSSSNTSGSITSTVSASTTAGFSVVTYTGTGANATVGHGLGVAPRVVLVKKRSATSSWVMYHGSLAATQRMILETTAGVATDASVWNSTAPTSSVFSLGNDAGVNGSSATFVAYCWAEIAGFSKFGSYTGNGSTDGTFVYTGFRPKYVIIKRTDGAGAWYVLDSVRNTYNVMNSYNEAQDPAAEGTFTFWDFLSNGFKLRQSASAINGSGQSFIYMAFAENPFKHANAR